MKYKAIIYDIDGTLLNTFEQNIYPLQRLVKEVLGKDMHYDELVHFTSHSGIKVLPQLGIDNKYYDVWVQYVNEYEEKPEVFEGFNEVLAYFDKKLLQGLVSSKREKQFHIDFEGKDIEHYFSSRVLATDVEHPKPDPEGLLKCLNELGVKPEEAIYIGDSLFDYQASKAAGMAFGLATWGNISRDGMDDIDYVFENPIDMIDALTK